MSQNMAANYVPPHSILLQQSHQHSVVNTHQSRQQMKSGLESQNQSMPFDQSQWQYITSPGQSKADPQNMFAQVRDQGTFSSQTNSQSPGHIFNSQHEQLSGQLLREQQQLHEQRLLEPHRLATVSTITELEKNKELREKMGTVQPRLPSPTAAVGRATSGVVSANGRSATTGNVEIQRNIVPGTRPSIVAFSPAIANAQERYQPVDYSGTTMHPTCIRTDEYGLQRADSIANASSGKISSTTAHFVSARLPAAQESSPKNNISVTSEDRAVQSAVVSASPAKVSAKGVKKATNTPVTKPAAKKLASKQASKSAKNPTQRGEQGSGDVITSTSSTADNEDSTMQSQQLCGDLVGRSNNTRSPDKSGRNHVHIIATQDSPFSASLLSASITSNSAVDADSATSQNPVPEDYMVWARKLAYHATDAKKQFDSLRDRLSNDEGKLGELMQKHTTSVRKAVGELKREFRDRATQCIDLFTL
ncbi:hypothetical protein V1509DRAFT_387761 [Lipomyces kononenkoae]